MGHSAGTHVIGVAGHCVKQGMGTLVGRLTGLDPNGPGPIYKLVKAEQKLDAGDGEFVDVIHTSDEFIGSPQRVGTVDFYANGGLGIKQPLCVNFTDNPIAIFVNGMGRQARHSRVFSAQIL